MAKAKVKQGDVFGRLTIIQEVEKHVYPSGDTRRKFLAQCSCGSSPKSYLFNQLSSGKTKSCGCLDLERKTAHGMHKTRQYQCWSDMKTRCDNPDNKYYHRYGGRGITYCDKWKTFEGFWEDMQHGYSDDLTLNRRDNDGMYCKENCCWDTWCFQNHMRAKREGTLLEAIGGIVLENGDLVARIKIDKRLVYLGYYRTEQEVMEAYDYASYLYYGDRPNKTVSTRPSIEAQVSKKLRKFINPAA